MEPTIVSGHGSICISPNKAKAARIVEAMVKAVEQCVAEGITDPEVIKARQIAAKESVS